MRVVIILFIIFLNVRGIFAEKIDFQEVQAKGLSVIYQGDIVAAFEAAVIDAKRNALESALGVYISSETIVQNYQLFTDTILTRTEGYVVGWKEVSRYIDGDIMEVLVTVSVRSGVLAKDFDAVRSLLKAKNPYVLVIVREKFGKNTFTGKWENNTLSQAEATLRDMLLKNEVIVKDPAAANDMRKAIASLYDGKYETIISIAKKAGANLIIFGDVVAENAGKLPIEGSSLFSYQCDITLRAIETDTGRIIASVSEHAAKPHVSDTAGMKVVTVMATEKAGTNLITDCVNWWKDSLSGQGYRIEMQIETEKYEHAEEFLRAVKYMVRGISSVELRSFEKGLARTEVRFMGPATLLLSEIRAKKIPIPFRVLATGETALTLQLIK